MKKVKEKKLLAFQKKSGAEFRALAKKVYRHRHKAKRKYPSRSNESIQKRRLFLIRFLQSEASTIAFLDRFVGTEEMTSRTKRWRRDTTSILALFLLNKITVKEASNLFLPISNKSYPVVELNRMQSKIQKVLPSEIRAFLPNAIVIDIDKNNNIKKINDVFVNEKYTLSEKIKVQKSLVYRYNSIVKKIKSDLRSKDEITRICALITSIIMETGIRPGRIGNRAVKIVNDKKMEVETFGAVSLGSNHVDFIKDNFVELKFIGKKGGVNTAQLRDREVISILKDYVDNALKKGSKYIFTTSYGEQFDYQHLSNYFNKNFKGFKITDFRKLRATETVFDVLKEQRDKLLKRIRDISEPEVQKLKKQVTKEIVTTIEMAHDQAQEALSHMDSSTTQDAYINPAVLLRFLSTAKVESTFRDYILKGKTKLKFDPLKFVKESQRVASNNRRY